MPTQFRSLDSAEWERPAGLCQMRLSCPRRTRKNARKVSGIWRYRSNILMYLWIFPRVFPAAALNLSGRISILAASWPGRADVLRALLSRLTRALSFVHFLSHPLSLPTVPQSRASISTTLKCCKELEAYMDLWDRHFLLLFQSGLKPSPGFTLKATKKRRNRPETVSNDPNSFCNLIIFVKESHLRAVFK